MTDYERGFKDGQQARKYEDARRDYERGYRDGYGAPWPVMPYIYPTYPTCPTNPWVQPVICEPIITWCGTLSSSQHSCAVN